MSTSENPFAAPEGGGAGATPPYAPPPGYGPPGDAGYGTSSGQPPYGQPTGYGTPPPGYGPPPYAQQPYGQPGYGYGSPHPPRGTNGMAVASLVLGVLWIFWIGSVLALVFGFVAKGQIAQSGEDGAGLATAGIVLGWIGVGFFALFFVLPFFFAALAAGV